MMKSSRGVQCVFIKEELVSVACDTLSVLWRKIIVIPYEMFINVRGFGESKSLVVKKKKKHLKAKNGT